MAIALSEKERNGLERMRELNQEYLASGKGSDKVRDFLEKFGESEELLLIYLKGRKYRPEHAFNTLKRKAEVRFDEYPEAFTDELPKNYFKCQEIEFWFLLKTRDSLGRRILVADTHKWDYKQHSVDELIAQAVHFFDKLLYDEDAMNNGLVFVMDCAGMSLSHGRQFSLHIMLKILHIFWFANPLKIKGFYFVNVAFYLTWIYEIIRPFLTKKLKERVFLTSKSKKFQTLHDVLSPDILPEFLGGPNTFKEIADIEPHD